MGTICILLGLIILLFMTGAGFFVSNMVLANQLYMSLLALSNTTIVYVVIVGIFFLIGLLICMGLVMDGMIYNKLNKLDGKVLKLDKAAKQGK